MEQKKKVIDGTAYVVEQMNALSSLRVQTKLLKVLGPAITDIKAELKLIDPSKITKEEIRKKAMAAILSLAGSFDDSLVFDLIVSLFKDKVFYEHTDGSLMKVSFDMHFTGKTSTMWKAVLFVLEVNFGHMLGKYMSDSPITAGSENVTTES